MAKMTMEERMVFLRLNAGDEARRQLTNLFQKADYLTRQIEETKTRFETERNNDFGNLESDDMVQIEAHVSSFVGWLKSYTDGASEALEKFRQQVAKLEVIRKAISNK